MNSIVAEVKMDFDGFYFVLKFDYKCSFCDFVWLSGCGLFIIQETFKTYFKIQNKIFIFLLLYTFLPFGIDNNPSFWNYKNNHWKKKCS